MRRAARHRRKMLIMNDRRTLREAFAILCGLLLFCTAGMADDGSEARLMKNVRQLTFGGKRAGEGYFSPDGSTLIFQDEREGDNPFYQIYMLSFETGETHRVSPGHGKTTCAFFRPGSDDVLFASTHLDPDVRKKEKAEFDFQESGKSRRYSWDYDETMDIFASRRDGSSLRRLTETVGYDAEGSYSPDGERIVFCSMRDAYDTELSAENQERLKTDPAYFGEIYIMNADGSGQTRLTDWPGYDGGPFFTPDGNRIVWRHFEENGMIADVYTMNLDGSEVFRMTEFGSMSWAPYFHPTSEYAVFASNKLGFSNFEVYMVDREGLKEPVRVTFTDGFDGLPVFSPGGDRLCWTTRRGPDGSSQLFLAEWNHEAAMEALREAPARLGPGGDAPAHPAAGASVKIGGGSSEITKSEIEENVTFIASDDMDGRMTGTEGASRAARFLADQFGAIGLDPIDGDSYMQEFPFTSGLEIIEEETALQIHDSDGNTDALELGEGFRPLGFSASGKVEGDVVFAGYGLFISGAPGEGYDSYDGLDVTDKIVLVLRYVPEEVSVERRQTLNRHAGLRYKAMLARERGAKGILVATGPNSPNGGELVPLRFDRSLSDSGILGASIDKAAVARLLAGSGKTLADIQSGLDVENPHASGGLTLDGVRVQFSAKVNRKRSYCSNVVGLLPPQTGDEYIMVGAHYDHIGHGVTGSLARDGEEGMIHNGADDNASGVSVVLEMAQYLADKRESDPESFKRGVLFSFWSGEEIGLVGSSWFSKNPVVPLESIAAYLNFDMVGRLRENRLVLQGVGSSPVWKKLIERKNVMSGFSIGMQEDPFLPTDVTSFHSEGVPVMSFFTGSHEDYNRPTDDASTLNYEGLERIAKFACQMVTDLVSADERPEYTVLERINEGGGARENLRAYLGTIPDYVQEGIEGVRLTGVSAGGPADRGGLQGGDIIVEFAGQKITNIYDYTYALDAVKIGEPVSVKVLREGAEVELAITPEARK